MIKTNQYVRSVLFFFVMLGIAHNSFAQTRAQLIEGAKKEGQLILSWGTGTMGGIDGGGRWRRASTKPMA